MRTRHALDPDLVQSGRPRPVALSRVSPVVLAALLASALAACGDDATAKRETQPKTVRTETVRLAPLADPIVLTGTVRARHEVPVAFRVGGKVERRLVDAGMRVKAGDLLATLDPKDLKLARDAAEADVRSADAEAARWAADEARSATLLAKGHTSQAAMDRVVAGARAASERLSAARSNLDLARNRLGYAELRAAADGIVTAVSVEPGQVVAEGRAVVTLAEDGPREAMVAVPESRVGLVAGSAADVTLWAQPGRAYAANLRELSPDADPVTRTFQARFTLADASPDIALGMTAQVRLLAQGSATGAILPASAVWWRGEQAMVWVVDVAAGRLQPRAVTIARLDGTHAAVSGDIADGDRVVAMGAHRLDASQPVRLSASAR